MGSLRTGSAPFEPTASIPDTAKSDVAEFGGAKPAEIMALSGARAFPPLILVLFHFSEGHGYRGFWPVDLVVARGYLWVEFFFTLSGFILTHVYGARGAELFTLRGYGRFLRARLIRLYPLHLFMLLVILGMVIGLRALAHAGGYVSIYDTSYHVMVDPRSFVLNLFLVQAWNTLNYLSWNVVAWFVSVEFALCLLFPIFLWLAGAPTPARNAWRGVALIAAGLCGTVLLLLHSKHGLDITYHNSVLRGLSDFSIGVGLAVLYRAAKRHDTLPAIFHSALQLALLGALVAALYLSGWSHTRKDIWTVLPMMGLVFALAFDRGIIAAALQTRIPQILGLWSYAIYMGQEVWLQAIRVIEQRFYPDPNSLVLGIRFSSLTWWLEPTLLVPVCILWGAALATCVEHPVAKALRHRRAYRLDRRAGVASS